VVPTLQPSCAIVCTHFVPQDLLRVLSRWLAYYRNFCQLGKSTLDSIDDYSGKIAVTFEWVYYSFDLSNVYMVT
jgi:hypothetical protein